MIKAEYLEKRKALLDEAEQLGEAGDLEGVKAKNDEIEVLDATFEEESLELANAAAQVDPDPAPVANTIINSGNTVLKEEENKMEFNAKEIYFKNLMGKTLTDEEKTFMNNSREESQAFNEEVTNEIMSKVRQYAPLLDEITLLQVKGNVSFYVEKSLADAAVHTPGADITASDDKLEAVHLGGYEIAKLVRISESVSEMSIPAFESWLTDMLAESIANKITDLIINGNGTSEAKGILGTIGTATATTITAANLSKLVAALPGGYDSGAKFLMSKQTFFESVANLQDSSKNPLVQYDGITSTPYIYGYPVMFDSRVAKSTVVLGNFKKYVGNLPEDVTIKTGYNMTKASNEYLGIALFDGCAGVEEAFVKIATA